MRDTVKASGTFTWVLQTGVRPHVTFTVAQCQDFKECFCLTVPDHNSLPLRVGGAEHELYEGRGYEARTSGVFEFPSLINHTVSVAAKQHERKKKFQRQA